MKRKIGTNNKQNSLNDKLYFLQFQYIQVSTIQNNDKIQIVTVFCLYFVQVIPFGS